MHPDLGLVQNAVPDHSKNIHVLSKQLRSCKLSQRSYSNLGAEAAQVLAEGLKIIIPAASTCSFAFPPPSESHHAMRKGSSRGNTEGKLSPVRYWQIAIAQNGILLIPELDFLEPELDFCEGVGRAGRLTNKLTN